VSGAVAEFIVVAGLSGGGRSQAGDELEDLGWFVIDNLPPSLIPRVAELAAGRSESMDRVALVVGTGPHHHEVLPALVELRNSSASVTLVYLEAATEVLVRRYEETRRRHPLTDGQSLAEAIEAERVLLEPVRAEADLVIDTSDLNVRQLRDRVVELFGRPDVKGGMQVTVSSFGYKHGIPVDADLVLDCRFLPNPHWEAELRHRTGLDDDVRRFVLGQELTEPFLERLGALLELLVPGYLEAGKSYLSMSFGCTGGRHRSVVIAQEAAALLADMGFEPIVAHRDLQR
jgi:RNase adapter protein RapZ